MARLPIGTSGNVEYDPKTYEVWIYETCKNKSSKKCGQKVWKNVGKLQQVLRANEDGTSTELGVFSLHAGTQYFCQTPRRLGLCKDMIDSLLNFNLTRPSDGKQLPITYLYFPQIPDLTWSKKDKCVINSGVIGNGLILLSLVPNGKQYALFGNGDEYWVEISSLKLHNLKTLKDIR